MKLSVIVVSWNTCELLARCLTAVYGSSAGKASQVFVVDNASRDGSAGMVRARFPQVTLIENTANLGFARANNQVMPTCQGDYVLLLNSDAFVEAESLQQMVDFMDTHPSAGAVAPKLLNPDGSFQASYARFPTLFSEALLLTGLARRVIGPYAPSPSPQPGEQAKSVDWVAGAALMVRRRAVSEIGLLDEEYFFYSEETDWCWRLWRGGWEVWYLPQVAVTHIGGASSRLRSAESYRQLYTSKVLFFAKAYGRTAGHLLNGLIAVLTGLRLVMWCLLRIIDVSRRHAETFQLRIHHEWLTLRHTFSRAASITGVGARSR